MLDELFNDMAAAKKRDRDGTSISTQDKEMTSDQEKSSIPTIHSEDVKPSDQHHSAQKETRSTTQEKELLDTFLQERNAKRFIRANDDIVVDGWDMAGQRIYYFTHHIYFSEKCTYLLLFDLSKGLDAEIDDESLETGYSRKSTALGKQERLINIIQFW